MLLSRDLAKLRCPSPPRHRSNQSRLWETHSVEFHSIDHAAPTATAVAVAQTTARSTTEPSTTARSSTTLCTTSTSPTSRTPTDGAASADGRHHVVRATTGNPTTVMDSVSQLASVEVVGISASTLAAAARHSAEVGEIRGGMDTRALGIASLHGTHVGIPASKITGRTAGGAAAPTTPTVATPSTPTRPHGVTQTGISEADTARSVQPLS